MPASTPAEERWPILSPLLGQLKSGYTFLPRVNDTMTIPDDPATQPRILILRCSSHADVEESLTHILLYDLVRRCLPEALIDLAFYSGKNDQEVLTKAGLPWPLSVRSLRGLAEFDLVLVNVSYVLELLNLMPMLEAAGLRPWSRQRGGKSPLVLLGGSSALSAQASVRQSATNDGLAWDSLADAIFFGEAEDLMGELLNAVFPVHGMFERDAALVRLTTVPGVWVPSSTVPDQDKKITKAVCLNSLDNPVSGYYPVLNGNDATTCRLQISFGCPFGCSFCFEGHERKPYRDVGSNRLIERANHLRRHTGARSLDLISFNFNTHKELSRLMPELNMVFRHVHFMSQRLDILNRTDHLLENELAADKRSYTLGVEGISPRLRRYYDKRLAESDIPQLCLRLLQAKVKEIKFFFIVSGNENNRDMEEFAGFLYYLSEKRRLFHAGCRLVFSFGVLCRMPFTPLQYAPVMLDQEVISGLLQACRSVVESQGFEFRTAFSPLEYELSQLMSLGGFELHELLTDLHRAGIRYGAPLPGHLRGILNRFWQAHQTLCDSLTAERTASWVLALSFVDCGIPAGELFRRYQECRASLQETHCPACEPSIPPTVRPGPDLRRQLSGILAEKNRSPRILVLARIPAGLAGASVAWLDAWFMRGLAQLLGNLDGVVDAELHGHAKGEAFWPNLWYGEAVFGIAWQSGSGLPERLAAVIGRHSRTDLVVMAILDIAPEVRCLQLDVQLPLSIGQLTGSWNRHIQVLGLGATMTKTDGMVHFSVPSRFKGRKSIESIRLIAANDVSTHCQIIAGPRFAYDQSIAQVLGTLKNSFLPVEIGGFLQLGKPGVSSTVSKN